MAQLELSFVTTRDLGSLAIRWFTHSDYSHVDIILPDGRHLGARSDCPVADYPNDPWLKYRTGVRIRPADYAVFSRDDRLILPCSDEQANTAYDWAYSQVGKPYDKMGLFRSFLFDDYNWRRDDSWWCSELAAVFIEKAGFPMCRTPANRVAPNDCFIYAGCFAK